LADLTISITAYNNNPEKLKLTIDSVLSSTNDIILTIVDNSTTDKLSFLCVDKRVEYIHNSSNVGFGKAHNLAINKNFALSKYHLVLNPDVTFDGKILSSLISFMDRNDSVGLVMPKVVYPDGTIQYLCKLLPTPFDLILRRFLPFKKYKEYRNNLYELKFSGYNSIMDIPYLSGCFMFMRKSVLSKSGLFDDRFFMYLEDTDLSRRIHEISRTVFFPEVSIIHAYEKGSYKNFKLLYYHVSSAVKYFNKWGWLNDTKRTKINNDTINRIKKTI